jgi:hypothetical protein
VCWCWRAFLNAKNDRFILDAGRDIFQWNGKEASRLEKAKAIDVTRGIRDTDRNGKAQIHILDSGDDDTAGSPCFFFSFSRGCRVLFSFLPFLALISSLLVVSIPCFGIFLANSMTGLLGEVRRAKALADQPCHGRCRARAPAKGGDSAVRRQPCFALLLLWPFRFIIGNLAKSCHGTRQTKRCYCCFTGASRAEGVRSALATM